MKRLNLGLVTSSLRFMTFEYRLHLTDDGTVAVAHRPIVRHPISDDWNTKLQNEFKFTSRFKFNFSVNTLARSRSAFSDVTRGTLDVRGLWHRRGGNGRPIPYWLDNQRYLPPSP